MRRSRKFGWCWSGKDSLFAKVAVTNDWLVGKYVRGIEPPATEQISTPQLSSTDEVQRLFVLARTIPP